MEQDCYRRIGTVRVKHACGKAAGWFPRGRVAGFVRRGRLSAEEGERRGTLARTRCGCGCLSKKGCLGERGGEDEAYDIFRGTNERGDDDDEKRGNQ